MQTVRSLRWMPASRHCEAEDIVQKEFLVQDPDGYLLRFTD